MPSKSTPLDIYQFKVTLLGIEPPIWRRFQIARGETLGALHSVLQAVMGWGDEHLHQFEINKKIYGASSDKWSIIKKLNEDKVTLAKAIPELGTRFAYEYDFGDSWKHELVLEKMLPREEGVLYPRCLEGERHCPPEDCGGVWGYAEVLEAVAHPENPEYAERREWVGDDFDPELFNVDKVNMWLATLS
jgi:pRiA4b ORF-3-like protein